MRSTALWTVAMVGMFGVAVVCFVMLISLRQLETTAAGDRIKLANTVIKKFGLNIAQASIMTEEDRDEEREYKVLMIEYQTSKDSGFDQDVMNDEMEQIALYTLEHWQLKEVPVEAIRYVHMIRHEIRGDGCFQDTYDNSLEVDNPEWSELRKKRNPYDFEKKDN